MIQRHSSRCELKIKLDLPCNGTTMTFFPLFPQKTSKSIGITPGKLWNCSWSQCLNIDIMNIYSNWIIHSAIKWGTFWHERRPVSDGHLTTVILRLKRKKNIPFSNGANSFIRGNDASASTRHPHHANCLDLKVQDQILPSVLFRQILDLNADCILIRQQAGREEIK